MSGNVYLFAAYAVTWIIHSAYLGTIAHDYAQLRRERRVRTNTIGRATYFVWWITANVLGFLCIRAIDVGQREFGKTGEEFAIFAVAALIASLIIRVATTILRLRDIGWTSWLSLITIIPGVNLILDVFLIFKPGSPIGRGENSDTGRNKDCGIHRDGL